MISFNASTFTQDNSMFTVETLRTMLAAAAVAVEKNLDQLNALDSATGDGDHGTAILAAMKSADKTAKGAGGSLSEVLSAVGWAVMSDSSGSTSSLTGSLYIGMSEAAPSDSLTTDQVIEMFESGLKNVRVSTKAAVGDKTLMDAQIPAIDAMVSLKGTGASLKQILEAAAKAARAGAESTKDLVAKFGRAKNLAQRTIGHYDAGATSTALIYEAFAASI